MKNAKLIEKITSYVESQSYSFEDHEEILLLLTDLATGHLYNWGFVDTFIREEAILAAVRLGLDLPQQELGIRVNMMALEMERGILA